MGKLARRRPSAGVLIGVIALVVAASGTAFAAGTLVDGDNLIKKHSLSGDRLRDATITGKQIKLSSLGPVPRAKTAANAQELGGHPASYFGAGGSGGTVTHSGLITATGGQTVTLGSFGPFTVSLKCNDDGGGAFDSEIDVTSTASNSEAFDTALTPGTSQEIDDAGPDTQLADNAGGTLVDFVNAPEAWMGYLIDAVFMPGTNAPCAASLLASKS